MSVLRVAGRVCFFFFAVVRAIDQNAKPMPRAAGRHSNEAFYVNKAKPFRRQVEIFKFKSTCFIVCFFIFVWGGGGGVVSNTLYIVFPNHPHSLV